MFTKESPESDRGQVGIGTLIVFIALVLVAAIAAGVLINTAGFLQSQAEATGEESTDQVSNNVQLVTASGEADSDAQEVDDIEAIIQLAPGSDAVRIAEDTEDNGDLDELSIDVDVFGADIGDVDLSELDDGLLQDGETETLVFDGGPIDAGDQAEVVITTEDGSQTTFILNVPDPISDDGTIRLG